ncbi:MAG: hypothetical protein ACYC7E_23290 [Armatimonadota bacterium]
MSILLRLRRFRPVSAITTATFLLFVTGIMPVGAMVPSSGDQLLTTDVPPGVVVEDTAIYEEVPVEISPATVNSPVASGVTANLDTAGAGVTWLDGKGLSLNLNMTNAGLSGLANGSGLSQLVTPLTLGSSLIESATGSSAPVNPTVTATASYSNKKLSATAQTQMANLNGQTPGIAGAGQTTSWSASYRASDVLTLSTSGSNSAQPGYGGGVSAFADGTPVAGTGGAEQQSQAFSLDYHPQGLPSLTLQHTTQNSSFNGFGSSGASTVSDTLASAWASGPWSASVNLGRSQSISSYTPAFADGTVQAFSQATTMKATNDTAGVSVNYRPNDRLSAGINITSNTGKTGEGADQFTNSQQSVQANVAYSPRKNLTITGSAQANTAKSNWSAQGVSAQGVTDSTQQTRNLALGAIWQAGKNLNVGAQLSRDSGSDNSGNQYQGQSLSANANWQVSKNAAISGQVAQQSYAGIGGGSTARAMSLTAQVNPSKTTTMSLGVQRSDNGYNYGLPQPTGDPLASTVPSSLPGSSSNAIVGSLVYRPNEKHDLTLNGQLQTSSGLEGQYTSNALGLGWNFYPNQDLSLSLNASHAFGSGGAITAPGDTRVYATGTIRF